LFLVDEPAPPYGPDPSNENAAGEPLDDTNDECALFHLSALVDE